MREIFENIIDYDEFEKITDKELIDTLLKEFNFSSHRAFSLALGLSYSVVNNWYIHGKMPIMTKMCFFLLLKNKEQKKKLSIIKEANSILNDLKECYK